MDKDWPNLGPHSYHTTTISGSLTKPPEVPLWVNKKSLIYSQPLRHVLMNAFLPFYTASKFLPSDSLSVCSLPIKLKTKSPLSLHGLIPLKFCHSPLGHIFVAFPYSFYALSWSIMNTFICTFIKLFWGCMFFYHIFSISRWQIKSNLKIPVSHKFDLIMLLPIGSEKLNWIKLKGSRINVVHVFF